MNPIEFELSRDEVYPHLHHVLRINADRPEPDQMSRFFHTIEIVQSEPGTRDNYIGQLTIRVDRDGVYVTLDGRKGGHKGTATAKFDAMDREEARK